MKILLCGCTGAMGRAVTELCHKTGDVRICAGLAERPSSAGGYPVYNDLHMVEETPDLILDFSAHTVIGDVLAFALARGIPVVIATTGHTPDEEAMIAEAAEKIPVLKSGNTSLGVHAILQATKVLTKILGEFDVEIIEKHHHFKKDAPSGTAKMLAEAVKEKRTELNEIYGRQGQVGQRRNNEIGIHAVRGGTIVGEHTVLFAGYDEVVEIKHTALSKGIFAKGALAACRFLRDCEPGLYGMDDVK
ncbi:MAG: 4-hydroxy-tetrahydrodipicolinate reductase [Eubacteriales bacterium]|nr:4-hydroxy-tetrahydrodipicolinate reductase [Eubacteriales bacterium]